MNYSDEFLNKLKSITAKRPSTVINHILKHGFITSKELKELYGYDHAPRAVRDVREQGIPIITERIKDESGKSIAVYRFGNPDDIEDRIAKSLGRTAISKALKQALIEKYGARCFIYSEMVEESLLQVDHRVPYEIGGEQSDDPDNYMLVCPSANRAKSWACEHCGNWVKKDATICISCFWTHPEEYTHIAEKEIRRITIVFADEEIESYNKLISTVGVEEAQQVIKDLIKSYIQ